MLLKLDDEFIQIARIISSESLSEEDWKKIDASDLFQTDHYCGGFDSLENAFTFSLYKNDQEYWFQLTLKQIQEICDGSLKNVNMRPAD